MACSQSSVVIRFFLFHFFFHYLINIIETLLVCLAIFENKVLFISCEYRNLEQSLKGTLTEVLKTVCFYVEQMTSVQLSTLSPAACIGCGSNENILSETARISNL